MILLTKTSDQTRPVCVCVLSSHLFWTSGLWTYQPGSHRGGRPHRISPPSFCGACLNFSREKDSAVPFPRRPWRRVLCTNELIVFHFLDFFFSWRGKLPVRVTAPRFELTSQRQKVSRYQLMCVASVALALVFMPGSYPTAYRATFPAFFMRLPLVCFYCLCVFVCVFYFTATMSSAGYFSCPFSSVCFPCLPPIPGLIWFGSAYLVTTAGFVADQLIM